LADRPSGSATINNPYAPPRASVRDIADIHETAAPADRSTRLAAAILDTIIFGAMVYTPLIFASVVAPSTAEGTADFNTDTPFGLAVIVVTIVGFVAWLWITVKFMHRNGQSIAKKILAIKVIRRDGSPISISRLFWLRNVLNGMISVIPLYGLIDVLFIFGDSRECLHDKIADTTVVKA
jgi:uncharacterized RDD family membrane protein YckC